MPNDEVPYEQLDKNIRRLVRALNAFPGVRTIGSCGGHASPIGDQAIEGTWWILFEIDRTEDAWLSLEFLAWVNNDHRRAEKLLSLQADSRPPWVNFPGRMLRFELAGEDIDPDELARLLDDFRERFFLASADLVDEGQDDGLD